MASIPQSHTAPQEYLEQERLAETKSEYFDGQVVAMAGASERHNLLVANLIMALGPRLRAGSCRIYPSDLKIQAGNRFLYPDASIVCGTTEFASEEQDVVTNPSIIFEVLSESTQAFDRGRKFLAYQAIPTLREYVLITQDEVLVECYQRHGENSWLYQRCEQTLSLPSAGIDLEVRELYLGL